MWPEGTVSCSHCLRIARTSLPEAHKLPVACLLGFNTNLNDSTGHTGTSEPKRKREKSVHRHDRNSELSKVEEPSK